jgi:hypothetical protein
MRVVRSTLGEQPELIPVIAQAPGPFYQSALSPRAASGGGALDPVPYLARLRDVPLFELTGEVDFEAAKELCLELLGQARV